jgi:hypothetical protein
MDEVQGCRSLRRLASVLLQAGGRDICPKNAFLCLYFVELEYASARFGNLMPCAQRKVAMAHLT